MADAQSSHSQPSISETLQGDGVVFVGGRLKADLASAIRAEAQRNYPNECCGLVVRYGKHAAIFPCRNISNQPRDQFHADPDDIARAEDAGEILMGYHSHVDTGPAASPADKTDAERNERASLIVAWPGGDMEIYYPQGWQAPILGRPFVHGVLDCYTLVRDVYNSPEYVAKPFLLPDFERRDDWWNPVLSHDKKTRLREPENLYEENFAKCGFRRVEEIAPLDAILIQMPHSEKTNHCAIYLGDGHIIHHPPGRLSVKQVYTGRRGWYISATRAILRHESNPQIPERSV